MLNYYEESIKAITEILKKNQHITEEEWNEYKKGKALLGSGSIMWIYSETSNWDKFIEDLKRKQVNN